LLQEEILHLKDRSDDGICGKSRLARARETFGTAIAAERFAAATFRNQARLSGVLQTDQLLGPEALQNLKRSVTDLWSGSENAGHIGILEEGLKWQAISVSPQDAEMLATRKFGVEQIARMFRLPPPILGDLSGGNFSSLVELNRWFAQHSISPWLTKWERAVERLLFSEAQRASFEVEFDKFYPAPPRRKPTLEPHDGIEVFRDCYITKCRELGVDIGAEIGIVTAEQSKLAGGQTTVTTPKVNCPDCHGRGTITSKKTGTTVNCKKCSGSGIAPASTKPNGRRLEADLAEQTKRRQ
jgi:hypothetical protein